MTRSFKSLIPTRLRSRRSIIDRSYIFTVKKIIIWDGSAPTSSRKKRRSKLLLLRKKKKTILFITEPPVITMIVVFIDQKRMPQASI